MVCMNSPMADDYLTNSLENYMTGIVNYINNQDDSKVSKCIVSYKLNSGCVSHPDLVQHEIITGERSDFIQSVTGW